MTYVKGVYYPRRRKAPEDRFWPKVDKSGDCWIWTGGTTYLGYGEFRMPGRRSPARAHRIAWELANGPIPEGAVVMHRCDNPPCVRPDHLELGSLSDNMQDMLSKGRGRKDETTWRGSQQPKAKLTEADVVAIRMARASGEGLRTIAGRYGVSENLISGIARRTRWAHVP